MLLSSSTFLKIASCFHLHFKALFDCYLNHNIASDVAIIQISFIGIKGHNVTVLPGVTVLDFHSDVVISDC